MKRIVFKAIQTIVLITALIANLAPTVIQAAGEPEPLAAAPASEAASDPDFTSAADVDTPADELERYQTAADCLLGSKIAFYNPAEAPVVDAGFPRPLDNAQNGPFDIRPGQPNSGWGDITTTPNQPSLDRVNYQFLGPAEFDPNKPLPVEDFVDLRMDPATGRRVLRGSDIVVLIALRNGSASCVSGGIPVTLKSVRFKAETPNGVFYTSPVLTPEQFVDQNGVPLSNANGVIPYTGFDQGFSSQQYFTGTISIPPTVTSWVDVVVTELVITCGDPTLCPNGQDVSLQSFDSYLALVGGPQGATTFKVAGGTSGRLAGEEAWIALEVTSLAGTGNNSTSIKEITDSLTSPLPECRTTAPADVQEGWFRSPLVNPTFENFDTATNFPTGSTSTRLTYIADGTAADNSPPGTDVRNMALGSGGKVYCIFKRTLNPDASGNFVLNANLIMTSYAEGGNKLTGVLPVNISFPVGQAAIEVSKTIVGPVGNDGNVKPIIAAGETLIYEITIRNVGLVEVDNLSFSDSLTGFFPIQPPSFTLSPLQNGTCADPVNAPCSITNQVPYTVPFNAPNPVLNFVEARGEIVGTNVPVVNQAVASIPKADSELTLQFAELTEAGAPNGDGYQPGERITYQLTYCNAGTQNFTSIEFVTNSPSKRNLNVAGENAAIEDFLPNYPIVEEILNGQVVRPNPLPFEPGCYGPIIWDYTIPALPTYQDPVFQQVRMRATRQDGSVIFTDATLVTPLTNNSIRLTAQLWDPVLNVARVPQSGSNTFTVLRGETLTFDLRLENLSPTQARCNVDVRWFTFNPNTGATTPISIPITMNWPGSDRELGTTATAGTGGNVATTISDIPGSPNIYRPQFQVNATAPDPLIIIFEADATRRCNDSTTDPGFITRSTLFMEVSNVQVSGSIQVQDPQNNFAAISEGRYPDAGGPPIQYRISYVATNIGSVPFTISDVRFCLLSGPPGNVQNCPSGLTMLGDNVGGNFGIDNTNASSRTFLTLQTRNDQAMMTLSLGENDPNFWSNPLVIQVVITGTDTEGKDVLIRHSLVFPLAQVDLAFQLSGDTQLVRGDANVPIRFVLSNTVEGVNLTNVQVLNLMAPVDDGQGGAEMPPQMGFGDQDYQVCTFDTGGVAIDILATDTSEKRGTCLFNFTPTVPTEGATLVFRAAAVATRQGETDRIADLALLRIEIIPHILVTKLGSASLLTTDDIPYTVRVFNQSRYQEVIFNASDGFQDVISPSPTGQVCVLPQGCPGVAPTIASFSGLTTLGATYRLAERSSASVSYELAKPTTGDQIHNSDYYLNVATLRGQAENGGEVTGSDEWEVTLECPLRYTASFIPPDPTRVPNRYTTDSLLTLGEEAEVRLTVTNLGNTDVTFTQYADTRYLLDELEQNYTGQNMITMPGVITWPTSTPGLLPAIKDGDLAFPQFTYTFTMKIRSTDYLNADGSFRSGTSVNLEFPVYYQSNLAAPLPCGSSTPQVARTWATSIVNPVVMTKTASTGLAFAGQTVNYNIDFYNISEIVDISVVALNDPLLSPTALAVLYPNQASPTTAGGLLPVFERDPNAPGGGLGIERATSGPHAYQVRIDDPEELTNVARVLFRAVSNNRTPPYVNPSVDMTMEAFAEIVTKNPLTLEKIVLSPLSGVAPRGTEVQYLLTVSNSSDFPITSLTVTDDKIDPASLPPCVQTTTRFCLGDEFTLLPDRPMSLLINHIIPDTAETSYVNTATALGTLSVDGALNALPPVIASASIALTPAVLTITPDVYLDDQCTSRLVSNPLRDVNFDQIPEATVGEIIYYGFKIAVGGGKTYENVVAEVTLGSADITLQNELNNYLIQLATNGINEDFVTGDASNVVIRDDGSTDPLAAPEVFRCLPYLITSRQPDPLPLNASINGIDSDTDLESIHTALPVLVDVGDLNIFISKKVTPISAFPGREVTYEISIENRSGFTIEIDDVWDTMLGGQVFFDDGDTSTPTVPGDYQDNPLNTSIPFNQPFDPVTGLGWAWPKLDNLGQPVIGELDPGDIVRYTYKRTVQITDPDPTINRAGVLATVLNPAGNVDASDEAITSLAVSPSQLRVTKDAFPTSTILGGSVTYTIAVVNVGDTTVVSGAGTEEERHVGDVFDVVVWDDRYNLQFAGQTQMVAGGPGQVSIQGGRSLGGASGLNDLVPFNETMFITYTLPTLPRCIQWDGQANVAWSPTSPTGFSGGTCQEYNESTGAWGSTTIGDALPLIDPFINTAYAMGKIDDPTTPSSELVFLEVPGSDTAVVDLINPALRIEKTAIDPITNQPVSGASIGSDVEYRIRVTNTGSNTVRIDRVIDVPDANLPPGNTITSEIPVESLVFENCPLPIAGLPVTPTNLTNLQGRTLLPTDAGGTSTSPLAADESALLPPGCSVFAFVTIQVPDPSPASEYTNVVQVQGVELGIGTPSPAVDLSSASIEIRSGGLVVTKRAFNCNTAPNGINTPLPDPSLPPAAGETSNQVCTLNTPGNNNARPGAQQVVAAPEGETVWYEIFIRNAGTDAYDRLVLRDIMLIDNGTGSPTEAPVWVLPNGISYTAWNWVTGATGQVFNWANGQLLIEDKTPGIVGDGPFGPNDLTTPIDESNLFEPGEVFNRPDPGPLDPDKGNIAPVITYSHQLSLPLDDPNGEPYRYLNRVTATGIGINTPTAVPSLSGSSTYTMQILPAQLRVTYQGCVEAGGNALLFDPDEGLPCVTTGAPGAQIWYRIVVENLSNVGMKDFVVTDTVRNLISNTDTCWRKGIPTATNPNPEAGWTGNVAGYLFPDGMAVCTYKRDATYAPLLIGDDPYTTSVTAGFTVDNASGSAGTPVTESATVRIVSGALLVTVLGCENPISATGGTPQVFDIEVQNLGSVALENVTVLVPDPTTGVLTPTVVGALAASGVQVLDNALSFTVPAFGPATTLYDVFAYGDIPQIGTATRIEASSTCEAQRVNGNLLVTKEVITGNGSTTVQPGDQVTYRITIENLGTQNISNLVVSDPRLQSAGLAWAWATTLGASAATSQDFTYTVPTGEDPILNTVTVTGNIGTNRLINSDEARLDIATGDILALATAQPNPVIAGNGITFNYEVCNQSSTAPYVLVDVNDADPSGDPLETPSGIAFVAGLELDPLTCVQFVRTVPTLASDIGTTISRALYAAACPAATPTCTPTADLIDGQSVSVNVIAPNSSLFASLTANTIAATIGDTIYYTLTITNVSSQNITLSGINSALGLTWGFPSTTLRPNESVTKTLTYVIPTNANDPVVENISIAFQRADATTGSIVATREVVLTSVANAGLAIIIDVPPTVQAGAPVTYTYRVTNLSNAPIADAYLEITPPATTAGAACADSLTGTAWTAGGAANNPPILPVGFTAVGTATCTLSGSLNPGDEITHTASANLESQTTPLQDEYTATTRILSPLTLTITTEGLVVPGGYAVFVYTLTNEAPVSVNGISIKPIVPSICVDWQLDNPSDGIWNGGTTIGANQTVTFTARCQIPSDFLTNPAPAVGERDFDHTAEIYLGSALQDTITQAITVRQPVEFSFMPEFAPGSVTEPTPWGPPPTVFVANNTTLLQFRFRNIGTPGFSVTGLTYNISFEGGPLETCEREEAYLSDGTLVTQPITLTNPNDYVTIDCYYRPQASASNLEKRVIVTAAYITGGESINLTIVNPVMRAAVKEISFTLSLIGSSSSSATDSTRTLADDGDVVQFSLLVENTGTVSLTNFNFGLNMRDLSGRTTITNGSVGLTPGSPSHTLNDLWAYNIDAGARCAGVIAPNDFCLISGTIPSHLMHSADLNYEVKVTDPAEFMFLLAATASSIDGVEVSDDTNWTIRVTRPIVELGGAGATRADNGLGNIWMFNRALFYTTPTTLVLNQNAVFNMTIRNVGFKRLINPVVTLTLNQGTTALNDEIVLSSANRQATFPVVLTMTVPDLDLLPGESTVATASWTVEGVIPPNNLIAQIRFQSDVDGVYPNYDVTSNAFLLVVAPDPTLATTDPDGNALDPNATEPTITKVANVESANPNDTVSWTLEVTNPSTNEMANIAVVDNIPSDLTVVDTSTSSGAVITTGNLVSVSIGALAPGERVTVIINTTVNLDASVPNLLVNTACATREGGTQVCTEGEVGIGASSDVNPATGFGTPSSFVPTPGRWSSRLPFLAAAFSIFGAMLFLSLSFTDRQRLMLMGLAALVVIAIIVGALLLSGGNDTKVPSSEDGTPPVVGFATATRLPETPIAMVSSPMPQPTYAPDVLATIQSFPPTTTPYVLPEQTGPRRLDIPSLSFTLPIPIVELPFINGEWDVANLGHNIGWLDQTTWLDPGWGNTVLAGHIQLSDAEPGPFKNLDRLVPGDEVLVLEGDTVTEFRVTEIFTVSPTDTDVTKPTANPVLTLITCTNWDEQRGVFSDRLVVRAVPAELVEQAAISGS